MGEVQDTDRVRERALLDGERRPVDRERIADRLLKSSHRLTLDPTVEVAWDSAWQRDQFFLPEELISLYGTPLWETMPRAQRVELSRYEAGCHAWTALWGENQLIQLVAQHISRLDPSTKHVQYALTELEEECRHSVMFARLMGKLGTPAHHRSFVDRCRAKLWKVSMGPIRVFTSVLIIEDVLDRLQRATMDDASVQPVIRDVARVHVVEEARHISYARAELERQMASCPALKRYATQFMAGLCAIFMSRGLIPPDVYTAVGLNARDAARQARASAHRGATLRWSAERLTTFFTEIGVIGPAGAWAWHRSRFL